MVNSRASSQSSLEFFMEQSDPALQSVPELREKDLPLDVIVTKALEETDTIRSVHFGPNEIFHRSPEFKVVCPTELWYTPMDYKGFKAAYRGDAKILVKQNKKRGNFIVSQAFAECQNTNGEQHLSSSTAHALAEYMSDCSHTGVERIASKEVYEDKRNRRQMLSETVMLIQQHSFDTADKKELFLRMACEEMSKPNTLLAHFLALAASGDATLATRLPTNSNSQQQHAQTE